MCRGNIIPGLDACNGQLTDYDVPVTKENYAEAGSVASGCSSSGKENHSHESSVENVLDSTFADTVECESIAMSHWQLDDNDYQNQVAAKVAELQVSTSHMRLIPQYPCHIHILLAYLSCIALFLSMHNITMPAPRKGFIYPMLIALLFSQMTSGCKDTSFGELKCGGLSGGSHRFESEQHGHYRIESTVYSSHPEEDSDLLSGGADPTALTSQLNLANDGCENSRSPPGHMGISWGSQGVFGPGLLAAASSKTLRASETEMHIEPRYINAADSCLSDQDVNAENLPLFAVSCGSTAHTGESKSLCAAKLFSRKGNHDSFGDGCSMVFPVRQWSADCAGLQSVKPPVMPGRPHEEVGKQEVSISAFSSIKRFDLLRISHVACVLIRLCFIVANQLKMSKLKSAR